MTEPAARFMRLCDVCGGYDSDPRHVTGLAAPSDDAVPSREFLAALPDGVNALAVAELMDPTTYVRHLQCCADRGCVDGSCPQVLSVAGDVTGDALLAVLESGAVDHLTTPSDTTVSPEA